MATLAGGRWHGELHFGDVVDARFVLDGESFEKSQEPLEAGRIDVGLYRVRNSFRYTALLLFSKYI